MLLVAYDSAVSHTDVSPDDGMYDVLSCWLDSVTCDLMME